VSKVGEKILKALGEFGDVLDSGEPPETRFAVRSYVMPAEPAEYDGPAVRAVRERYSMSQGGFARFLCVSPATVQSWEQGRRVPSPIARRLLDEMAASPEHFRERFARLATETSGRSLPPVRIQSGVGVETKVTRTAKKPRAKIR
jgi:DNA-binding transcriptional regulator YiaG